MIKRIFASRLWALGLVSLLACTDDLEPFDWSELSFDAGSLMPDAATTQQHQLDAGASGSDEPLTGTLAAYGDASSSLPEAFKGYELYAWNDAQVLRFTLIVGTNRQKTLEEILGNSQVDAAYGRGSQQLSQILMRIPAGSSVSLHTLPGLPALTQEQRATVDRLVARGGAL